MSISQIGDIHLRTPGSVSYKLKSLGFIENTTSAKGYYEYKASKLYTEIVEKERRNPTQRTSVRSGNEVTVKVQVEPFISQQSELTLLNERMSNLEKDVKEILRIMHAIYEIET